MSFYNTNATRCIFLIIPLSHFTSDRLGLYPSIRSLPVEEMKSHTDSLSKKLLKPKQKLGDEVQLQLSKIKDYAPEVLGKNLGPEALPWESTKELASAIQNLDRTDIIKTWDNIVAGKRRSRIVSHVYGSSFPLSDQYVGDFDTRNRKKGIETLKSMGDITIKRESLLQYTDNNQQVQRGLISQRLLNNKVATAIGIAGATLALFALSRKNASESTKSKK